jgi:NagD protein
MPKTYLIDMDGVLVSGRTIIPGANEFIERLKAHGAPHLVLTNNSLYTPGDLAHRLQSIGLDIPAERIFTSALATCGFTITTRPSSGISNGTRSSCQALC